MNYYDRLLKTKEELDNLIKNYQNTPVNNFINTGLQTQNMYEVKKLNDNEEVENILIARDTMFMGNNKMEIKKMDGTIEKYNIEKYYPVDEKDEMIKTLNKKVEELERRLKNEPTEYNEPTTECDKSTTDDDVSAKS